MIRLGLAEVEVFYEYFADGVNGSTAGDYTESTSEINSPGGSPVAPFFAGSTIALHDSIYFGHKHNRFQRIVIDINQTNTASDQEFTWEYYNSGSQWVPVPTLTDGTSNFSVDGVRDIVSDANEPSFHKNWIKATVNGCTLYWMRCRHSAMGLSRGNVFFNSASLDLTLPNPRPTLEMQEFGRLHQAVQGTRVFDRNALKRRYTFTWTALDQDDRNSIRERAAASQSTCITFPTNWNEDVSGGSILAIVDPTAPLTDEYVPPELHNVTVTFLEV